MSFNAPAQEEETPSKDHNHRPVSDGKLNYEQIKIETDFNWQVILLLFKRSSRSLMAYCDKLNDLTLSMNWWWLIYRVGGTETGTMSGPGHSHNPPPSKRYLYTFHKYKLQMIIK